MSGVTIWHNPGCSNARGALELLRERGLEPRVVEYLKTPPTRAEIAAVVRATGQPARALVREKEPLFAELGLGAPGVSDDQLIDAMAANPVLINRPVVITPRGARLCRPPETVLELLD